MKSILSILVAIVLISLSGYAQNSIDSSRVVRVLTFNILHGANTNNDFDLDVIARVITEAKPDLVAMQEVDFKTRRAGNLDLATELGCRTAMAPLFGKAMKYDNGEYGEGVLSKYSFLVSKTHALPCSPGNEPRAALEVIILLPSNDTIAFIGSHLDHTNDETDRISQANKINEIFSSNKYPSILAGDLNAEPGSAPINILEEMWKPTYNKEDPAFTYPSDNPTKKIDYIMYYPTNRWRILNTEVIIDTVASDHCGYLVVLELLNE